MVLRASFSLHAAQLCINSVRCEPFIGADNQSNGKSKPTTLKAEGKVAAKKSHSKARTQRQGSQKPVKKRSTPSISVTPKKKARVELDDKAMDDLQKIGMFTPQYVLNIRIRPANQMADGKECLEYLIKWKGWDSSYNTWEVPCSRTKLDGNGEAESQELVPVQGNFPDVYLTPEYAGKHFWNVTPKMKKHPLNAYKREQQ